MERELRIDEVPEYIEALEEKVAKLEKSLQSHKARSSRRRQNGDPILGLNLTRLRKEHGWSTREAARRANMSQSFYCLIEDARSGCSLVKLRSLAEAFGVSVEDLASLKETDAQYQS